MATYLKLQNHDNSLYNFVLNPYYLLSNRKEILIYRIVAKGCLLENRVCRNVQIEDLYKNDRKKKHTNMNQYIYWITITKYMNLKIKTYII